MRFYLILFIIINHLFCHAQGWQRKYQVPNAQNNYSKAIYETTAGNYIAFGTSYDTSNGGLSNKLCIIGLDSQGHLQWTKKYGNTQCFYYDNTFVSRWGYKRGNYIYFTCGVKNGNENNGILVQIDFNGDTIWQRTYRDSSGIILAPQRVTGSLDGGLLITGFVDNGSNSLCFLIKTDANGHELWRKKFHKAVPDVSDGKAIIQDSLTKKIIIGGYQYIGNANDWHTYDNILILDSLGVVQSQTSVLGTGGTIFDLIQTKNKDIVTIGAKTYSLDSFGDDMHRSYISRFDINNPFSYLWLREYSGTNENAGYTCVYELPGEKLIVGGFLDTLNFYGLPANLLACIDKWDKNGNLIGKRQYDYKYNNANDDNGMDMLCLNPTSDGGFVSAIQTFFYNPDRLFYVKYDSLLCDSSLAYCAMVATGIQSNQLSSYEIAVYPNPAGEQIFIDLPSASSDEFQVVLTDLSGREVKRERLKSQLDLKDVREGAYLLKIADLADRPLYQTKIICIK